MQHDGRRYIGEAMDAGAVAILTDRYDPFLKKVTQVICPHPEKTMGVLASRSYRHHPSKDLFLVGITGTDGKTTTAYIIHSLFEKLVGPSGLISTIAYVTGNRYHSATRTTPDVCTNHRMLREMVVAGCQTGVMEVSSHALDQNRVDEIDFDVAIFTNLSPEHLDYHGDMESYARTKQRLFSLLKAEKGCAVVNCDDPRYQQMISHCDASVLTYGIEQRGDLSARDVDLQRDGSRSVLSYRGEDVPLFFPIPGLCNLSNALAATGALLARGFSLEEIAFHLARTPHVPGRFERVGNSLGREIIIDYAHTPQALEKIFRTLTTLPHRRIITVFGCGGDRDRIKRPLMAKICETHSAFCIVTNDNPRSEDPEEIVKEIFSGFQHPSIHLKVLDRREAIHQAIEAMNEEDILLIAGKGHETGQIFAHQTLPFDDRQVVEEICQQLGSGLTFGHVDA